MEYKNDKPARHHRAPNFSAFQNFVLQDLVDEYKAIVENSRPNDITMEEKRDFKLP